MSFGPKFTGAKSSEMFLCNVRDSEGVPQRYARLKTVRLGEVALDIDGKMLPGYRPVFIDRSEYDALD